MRATVERARVGSYLEAYFRVVNILTLPRALIFRGIVSLLFAAYHLMKARRTWGWSVFQGLLGVFAGVATVLWPALGAVTLLTLLATFAVLSGVTSIVLGMHLRKMSRTISRKISTETKLGRPKYADTVRAA